MIELLLAMRTLKGLQATPFPLFEASPEMQQRFQEVAAELRLRPRFSTNVAFRAPSIDNKQKAHYERS